MVIKQPFGPWQTDVLPNTISRYNGQYKFWVTLDTYNVTSNCPFPANWPAEPQVWLKAQHDSLPEPLAYVDGYVDDSFYVAHTTEQKLAEALAEIDALKLKLHTMPLAVGQNVRVI